MTIKGKVVFVTGAAGGIGQQLAAELLKKGAIVIATDYRQEALNALPLSGQKNFYAYSLDITDRLAVDDLSELLISKHGYIDMLINCAGIIQPFVTINDLNFEYIEKVMNVNFYGTLYMTKAFLPHLLKRPEAYIANVSSMGGFLPVPGQSVYGASKAAVKLLTEGLYAELLQTNVHVSTVFPGATATNITANSGVKLPNVTTSNKYPMLSAEQAARSIIKGIEKNKPLIYTGKDAVFMNLLYRMRPVYATRYIARKMQSLLQ